MELLELKAKVYDLMKERGTIVFRAQAIEKEVEQLSAQIAEMEAADVATKPIEE